MNKDNQEIEIKIKLDDPEALYERALSFGGEELKEKEGLEHDVMYDDGKGFFDAFKVLRLRTAPFGNLLTYKEKNQGSDQDHFLVRTEIETYVTDAKAMDEIIQKLEFVPYRIKEKYVRKIRLQEMILEFHKLPFIGEFIEIEGDKADVEKMVNKLNLDINSGINRDYTSLFHEYCDDHNLPRITPQTFEAESTIAKNK
ncbi:MAG: class IV adenylate cyclase [Candidatus Doudnabacteria bacterium]|nr:class IV adenylate cyclase [Candidatus Doudnabacteria bacterium]